ncbi:MAG: protoheme IX farnesyltransferase [Bdellovibrionales bacterium]|nr:protoheme IX farnesyltransferase [Bdellovibrionales bacterium]
MGIAITGSKPVHLGIYRELSKSGIVALVLISVLGGYLAGHPFEQPLDGLRLLVTLLGVLGVAAGSSALNHWQDREMDARMPRTAKRPIPSGRISEGHALAFAFGAMAIGLSLLALLSWKLVALAALAIFSYNVLYTLWWKRTMPFAAVPGALPGALPILMGYAAADGNVLTPGGIYLFAILFFWQMPHFWVLALRFTDDYAKGGVPTLPVAHGTRLTVGQIVVWCLAYCALALGAPLFIRVGAMYLAVAIAVSAKILWELRAFARAGDEIANPGSKLWLRFFLWVNFSLIGYVGGVVADLWSVYLIRHVKAAETVVASPYEFPEERAYTKSDRGFSKYGAASLHGKKKVVLTFDDGPDPKRAPMLLDVLKKYGVHATFFMVGDKVDAESEPVIRRELREGHLVAAHSLHHRNSNDLSEKAFKLDLWTSLSKLFPSMAEEGVFQKEVYFRFPFGAYGAPAYNQMNTLRSLSYEKYGENCINFVFWNVDSDDWVPSMTSQKIVDGVMAQLEGGTAYEHVLRNGKYELRAYHVNPATAPKGGVILMHEIHDRSLAAVPLLIERLERAGYEIVPLNSVKEYSFAGKTCQLRK